MQVARANLGVAVVNGEIYTIGGNTVTGEYNFDQGFSYGINGSPVNTNEQYDPSTNSWTFKAPMPTLRDSFAIAIYKDNIYCIGGRTRLLTAAPGSMAPLSGSIPAASLGHAFLHQWCGRGHSFGRPDPSQRWKSLRGKLARSRRVSGHTLPAVPQPTPSPPSTALAGAMMAAIPWLRWCRAATATSMAPRPRAAATAWAPYSASAPTASLRRSGRSTPPMAVLRLPRWCKGLTASCTARPPPAGPRISARSSA